MTSRRTVIDPDAALAIIDKYAVKSGEGACKLARAFCARGEVDTSARAARTLLKTMPRKLILLLLAVAVVAAAAAGVYKWVDEQGTTHYSETPPTGKKSEEMKLPESPPASSPHRSDQASVGLLLQAIESGDVARVSVLLQSGVDPNAQDQLGRTALMYAGINGQTHVMKMLIDRGADVNAAAQGYEGVTPLIASVIFGDPAAIRLLLEHGANVNARGRLGQTALTFAIDRLQTAPADRSGTPNVPERSPYGDLTFATKKELKEVIELLERADAAR